MPDDPNNFRLHVEFGEVDVLPDWVLAGEIRACEMIVDVDRDGRAFAVLIGHESPALEGDSHGFAKAALDQKECRCVHVAVMSRLRFAFDPERQGRVMDHGARTQRDRYCLYAGYGSHLVVEVAQAGSGFG